jgi:hypothetical protein
MVLTASIAGRWMGPAPMSDQRTMPRASAAARRTLARFAASATGGLGAASEAGLALSVCAIAEWDIGVSIAASIQILEGVIFARMIFPQKR